MTVEKTALVLCGGGSLGAYEVGAWKALRELGYHFDVVTGTSIGALNGAFVALDEYDKLVSLWNTITKDRVFKGGYSFDKYLGRYLKYTMHNGRLKSFIRRFIKNKGADISPFKELCKEHISVLEFKNLKTKFGIIVCDYPSIKEKKILVNSLDERFILPYIHASSACYPIFPKERIGKRLYVDGGYKNNLPIDYALKLGATKVIAVGLNGIPRVPQKYFYTKFPFVRYIHPRVSLGGIMDFTQEMIQRNMTLGYNDTMKEFKVYAGSHYTIIKTHLLKELAKTFSSYLALLGNEILHHLEKVVKFNSDEVEYYISCLEKFALAADIPFVKAYQVEELLELVYNHFFLKSYSLDLYNKKYFNPDARITAKNGIEFFIFQIRNSLRKNASFDVDFYQKNYSPMYWLAYCFYFGAIEHDLILINKDQE